MSKVCPACKNATFPVRKRIFATWPFHAKCRKCGARIRLDIPFWQNFTAQVTGQIVFWSVLVTAIDAGIQNLILGGSLGAVLALAIVLIPGFFAELKPLKRI